MLSKRAIGWNIILTFIYSPTRFFLNIYLASLLLPADYGKMVVPLTIISISDMLIDSGLRASLIQKSTLKKDHCSTIFFFNVGISFLLTLLFISLAGAAENYFKIGQLRYLITIVSAALLIKSTAIINEARLQIKGDYKAQLTIEFISYLLAYVVAIILAKNNFGPYSIAILGFTAPLFYTIGLFYYEKFIPEWQLVKPKLVYLHWRMGKNLLSTGLLNVTAEKLDELILTKLVSPANVGLYNKSKDYTNVIAYSVSKLFSRPWFSEVSKKSTQKKIILTLYNRVSLFFIVTGIISINFFWYYSEAVVHFALGKNWSALPPYLNILLFSTLLYVLNTFSKYTLYARAKSFIVLKIDTVYFLTFLILMALLFSLNAMYISIPNIIMTLIYINVLAKYVQYVFSFLAIKKDMGGSSTLLLMFTVSIILSFFHYYLQFNLVI